MRPLATVLRHALIFGMCVHLENGIESPKMLAFYSLSRRSKRESGVRPMLTATASRSDTASKLVLGRIMTGGFCSRLRNIFMVQY